MILRLSQKLATKVKAGPLSTLPLDVNPLADWSAHLFTYERTQYILLSNTKSLYSTVMMGRGITDTCDLIDGVVTAIRDSLQSDGHDQTFRRFIAPHSANVQLAKALNRSVIGSMNDFVFQAKIYLQFHQNPPFAIGSELNDAPMSALSSKTSAKYGYPRQSFNDLVECRAKNASLRES